MKRPIVVLLFLFSIASICAQDNTGSVGDIDIAGVYRAYPITRMIAVQTGQGLGFAANSAGRTADSPYLIVGLSDDGVLSIQNEPYRFEWVEETPGHIRFWPADATHRFEYQYQSWNVQPIVDPDAFVVTEYDIFPQFEDDTAIAGQVLYFRRIVPGGSFSDNWIDQEQRAMEMARDLVNSNPWN